MDNHLQSQKTVLEVGILSVHKFASRLTTWILSAFVSWISMSGSICKAFANEYVAYKIVIQLK